MIEQKEQHINPVELSGMADTLILNIFRVSHLVGRVTNRELARLGFSLQLEQVQILVLAYLHCEVPLSQQDIANLLQKDKAGIQRSVKTLERDGYLRINSDLNDRRRNLITLTPAGKLVAQEVMGRTLELDKILTNHLNPEEVKGLLNVLKKLASMLES
ncbi:MarR family winged helix-turn-helix transcriptional regulator [Telluribacter sp. SYSU D00476]|uniref:MarR family winged helix-turn-helix transcriptional regulator n=1 Tax=Telluribacter sp. SYSU D00476 TaxID=2811430 RepID=UPI001FF40F9B|nr:MarR family transcriptional regulator [Telluribacter sp. SYSU D00476]